MIHPVQIPTGRALYQGGSMAVPSTAAAFVTSGYWVSETFQSRAAHVFSGSNSRFDVWVRGRRATLRCGSNNSTGATAGTVSVDGRVARNVLTGVTNQWSDVVLFEGLNDGWHSVTFIGSSSLFRYQDALALQVYGADPRIEAFSTLRGVEYPIYTGSFNTNGRVDVFAPVTAGSYPASGIMQKQGGSGKPTTAALWFHAKSSAIRLWSWQDGSKIRVLKDGAWVGPAVTLGGAFNYDWVALATGLDDTTESEYAVFVAKSSASGLNVYSIRLDGGAGAPLQSHSWGTPKRIAGYGDSITEYASAYSSNEASDGYLSQFGLSLAGPACIYNLGWQGTTVSSTVSGANSGESRTAQITGISPAVDHVIVEYGTNDAGNAVALATFETAYTAMLNSLLSGTIYKIWCLGIPPRGAGFAAPAETTRANFNTRITNSIAACSDPTRVTYVNPDSPNLLVLGATDYVEGASGVHPTAATMPIPGSPTGGSKITGNLNAVFVL